MSDANLVLQAGRLHFGGVVHYDNAEKVYRQGLQLLPKAGTELVIDLANLSQSSTLVVAILVQWLRTASQAGQQLRVANMPDKLAAIIGVSGLTDAFPNVV